MQRVISNQCELVVCRCQILRGSHVSQKFTSVMLFKLYSWTMTAILEIPRGEADYRPDRTSEGSFFASWSENVTPGGVEGGDTHIFFFFLGGGGGVCRPVLKTLTLFQTKIYDFPYPISNMTLKMYTNFRPCEVWQFEQLSMDLRRTGLRDAPNDVHVSFSSRSMSTATHVTLKMVSQTKQTEYAPYFRPKWQNLYPISD